MILYPTILLKSTKLYLVSSVWLNTTFFVRKHLRKNKRAYSRLLKQRKFKIENLENEYKLPLI